MPKYKPKKGKKPGATERFGGTEERYLRVRWIGDLFDKYERYWDPEIERYRRNARFSWGLNFGQWPSYVVEKLREEGRRVPTYNLTGWKTETLLGSFIANGFDMRYQPTIGKLDSLTLKLQDMLLTDKSNFDYDTSERMALRDCFNTAVGYERMFISDLYHEFGNIAYEPLDPLYTLLTPNWKSPYIRDINDYMTWEMSTPMEVAREFPESSDILREMKEREEIDGIDYGEFQGAVPLYAETEEKWTDRHRVMHFHWVKVEEYDWEYDIKNKCPFPETGFPRDSEEDRAIKMTYIKMMRLDPNFDITWTRIKKRTKYYEAICPTIDRELLLRKGKDKIQTNNCNIYPLGRRFRKQFKGITDDLYDINVSTNRLEMNMDDIHMRSAKGAFAIDRAVTGGNDMIAQQIEQAWNDPAARIWLEAGSTENLHNGGIVELPHSPISGDTFHLADRRYDIADRFSLVPAAQDARTEGKGESGKLYQSKYQAGLIGQRPYMKIYETHKREKVEAYARQAKVTYSGMPREFGGAEGIEGFVINRPGRDAGGNRVVLDDISKLPLMKVVTTPSRMGADMRTELRGQYLETLQLFSDPQDRLLRLVLIEGISETQQLSEEQKEEMSRVLFLLKQEASLASAVNVVNLQMQLKKLMEKATQQQVGAGDGQQAIGGPAGPGPEEPPQQSSFGGPAPPEEGAVGTPQEDFTQVAVNS